MVIKDCGTCIYEAIEPVVDPCKTCLKSSDPVEWKASLNSAREEWFDTNTAVIDEIVAGRAAVVPTRSTNDVQGQVRAIPNCNVLHTDALMVWDELIDATRIDTRKE